MAGRKCPYCNGDGRKVDGQVTGKPSHLTFGYGVRTWQCSRCGEKWAVCYSIPPKGSRSDMPQPREGILRLSFQEGVRGYASPVVLTATVPASPEIPATEEESVE